MISIMQILKLACNKEASDIHLTSGSSPVLRVNGELVKVNTDPLTSEQVKELCYSLISDEQKAAFEENKSLDFSFFVKGLSRFRGALMFQKASVAGTFRLLNNVIPDIRSLGLPEQLDSLVTYPYGLVLITGPTGSGKTTTISSCINKINTEYRKHILTIEDPIEIVYEHKNSIINQREIGVDCDSFSEGLRTAMRVDPDICLVGEMRDKETIESVLKLAETGHLLFSTLHTNTAAKSIDRILSAFHAEERGMVQNQLSTVLQAIVSQRLLPSKNGGRKAVTEILFANPAVRNLIREDKIFQLYNVMQTSYKEGMMTMNHALAEVILNDEVEMKDAFEASPDKDELYNILNQKKPRRKAV